MRHRLRKISIPVKRPLIAKRQPIADVLISLHEEPITIDTIMPLHLVITGASSGIGRELAILASQQGHTLSLCGRHPDKLQATIHQLAPHTNVFSQHFCVSDHVAIETFAHKARKAQGDIDILINCAGLNHVRAAAHELDIEALDWQMRINCYAPIQFMQSIVPQMKARRRGTLVNVLSTVCLYANPGISAYTASKSALDGFAKVMRKELRGDNIKVLSVYPGGVNTTFRAAERPEYLSPASVAKAIFVQLENDEHAHIHELVLRPQIEENYC